MKLDKSRFWNALALPATVAIGLAMLVIALALLAGMAGGAKVALAAPPPQEPVCDIDPAGKTPDEVRAELKACVAQLGGESGGIGIQAQTSLTMTKSVAPTVAGEGNVVTYTIAVRNPGTRFRVFDWQDNVLDSNGAMQYVSGSLTTAGPGMAFYEAGHYPDLFGFGWLNPGQVVTFGFSALITECHSSYQMNTAWAWDWMEGSPDNEFSATVSLGVESVIITKTVDPQGAVRAGDYVTYTVSIHNYGCDVIRAMMADDVDVASLIGDYRSGWTVPGGTGWWGTGTLGGWVGTGSNHLNGGTLYPPGTSVYKDAYLYFTGTVNAGSILDLVVPARVRDTLTGTVVVTNTAEVWVWDLWWESEPWWSASPTSNYYEKTVVNSGPGGIFLPIILKNYQ